MRVTGGEVKGYRLKVPKGDLVRPTTDMVRQALFSMLGVMANDWRKVLDLYAGSGALGIEALSRGAGWVDFVEREPRCCAIIKDNLEKTGFKDKAHVYCCNVKKALTFLSDKYDIILMDAPYSDRSSGDLLQQLAESDIINVDSLVAVSHSNRSPLSGSYDGLRLVREQRYGDTRISIYHKGG